MEAEGVQKIVEAVLVPALIVGGLIYVFREKIRRAFIDTEYEARKNPPKDL